MKESKTRARLVCTRCHERKVRCNLSEQPNGTACRNCQREQCPCRKYLGARKRRLPQSPTSTSIRAADPLDSRQEEASPTSHYSVPTLPPTPARRGYFGTESVLSISDELPNSSHGPILPPYNAEAILALTNATLLPSEPYRAALREFYDQQLYPAVPVLDRDESCFLLQQTLCFAGSVMRRPGDHPKNFSPDDIYARIKVLLFLGLETDILALLKAYCVLGCWTPLSPHIANLDHPWHWTGVAIRVAIQLGFHKESTHLMSRSSTQSRDIWWYLFCNDTLQSTCFGRPPMIRIQDFDVALPRAGAPVSKLSGGRPFIQLVMNLSVIGSLASLHRDIGSDELRGPIQTLQRWISNVPPELTLFDQNEDRNAHDRWAIEIHIYYFTSIILLYLLPGSHRQDPAFQAAAVLASSCVVRLYEAMLYRDEINFLLPIHSWLALAAAIPQFYPLVRSSQISTNEEIELLQSVLVQLSAKHNSANLCLCKIERLQKDYAERSNLQAIGVRGHATAMPSEINPEATWFDCVQALFPFPNSISPRMEHLMPHLGTFKHPVPENTIQPLAVADDVTFEWADLNFDNLSFLGSDFNMETTTRPFGSQGFNLRQ